MTSTVRPGLQYIDDRTQPNVDAAADRENYISRLLKILLKNIDYKLFEERNLMVINIQYHKIVQFKVLSVLYIGILGLGFLQYVFYRRSSKLTLK